MFWYEEEVKQLERKPSTGKGEKKRILFYGSSSIRMWETLQEDYPDFEIVK